MNQKHENIFDGTVGNYISTEYKIRLLEGPQRYHVKPFPIPKVHEETLKTEFNRLVYIADLKLKKNSEWAAPTFIIPKKNGTVCFISDLRELNKINKRKPFPIPKIQYLLLKLESFKYASSLEFNMGHYQFKIYPF